MRPQAPISKKSEHMLLPEVDLKPGDILFKKCYSLFEDIYAFGIGVGQIVGVKAKYGSRTSEHLMMAIGHPTPYDVIESDTNGVTCNRLDKGDHVHETILVYRCREAPIAIKAMELARRFMGLGRPTGQEPPAPGQIVAGSYAWGSGIKNMLLNHNEGKRAATAASLGWLSKLSDFCNGTSSIRPNYVCSSFVAAIYELAAQSMGRHDFMLGVDPQKMIPKAYEHCLNVRPECYERVGRARGH